MRIIFAPDSFKGTLSSRQVCRILEEAALKHFPGVQTVKVPIADGGEGTVESLLTAAGGEIQECLVQDPLGRDITARYGIIRGEIAVFEMAQASGLPLLKPLERNPLKTSTYGTGQMLKHALDLGLRQLFVGIGGSATNDGGIGAIQALGGRFLDRDGDEVGIGGEALSRIAALDLFQLDPRIQECKVTVICDVNNPLTGPRGATHIYGPQKGAQGETLEQLEAGMENYRQIIIRELGMDMNQLPGAGAAGGLGAALVAFLGGQLKPGTETVLDLVRFDELLKTADLVVTGEGRIDGQTAFGKVPVGVARRAQGKGVPVVAISGTATQEAALVYDHGIQAFTTCIYREMTQEEAMENSALLLAEAADRLFRLIKVGMSLRALPT